LKYALATPQVTITPSKVGQKFIAIIPNKILKDQYHQIKQQFSIQSLSIQVIGDSTVKYDEFQNYITNWLVISVRGL